MVNRITRLIRKYLVKNDIPKKNIIIICYPRTGSTYLLNLLRNHNQISMIKSYNFFSYLGLKGRRYPMDLLEHGEIIETSPFTYEAILENCNGGDINIEKIHPEFYNFNTNKFINKIQNEIKKGHEFYFVHCDRDFNDALNSYINYKKRNKAWHTEVKDLKKYYIASHKSIIDIKNKFGGSYVKFNDLMNHPVKTLSNLYKEIPFGLKDQGYQATLAVDRFTKDKIPKIFKHGL